MARMGPDYPCGGGAKRRDAGIGTGVRRLWPIVLAALLVAPAPADATIRVVDLRTGAVRTVASAGAARPLGWHGRAMLGFDGRAVRRYPGGRRLVRLPGARDVVLRGRRIAAVAGGGVHIDRVVVTDLRGRRLAARRYAFVDSLAWSRDGRRLAVGWEDGRSHLTILTPALQPLRTVASPAPVTMSPAGWAPDGRTLTFVADQPRLGVTHDQYPSEVRSLEVATGRQTVLLRGTRCDGLVCELLDEPQAASGGRVALVRDLDAVALLRPGARPQALALPAGCDGVAAVAWAGTSLAVVYTDGATTRLALLPRRTIATLGRREAFGLLVSGRRAAVYQR
jgi:hypothetical protein